jgi:hypothetical protein
VLSERAEPASREATRRGVLNESLCDLASASSAPVKSNAGASAK